VRNAGSGKGINPVHLCRAELSSIQIPFLFFSPYAKDRSKDRILLPPCGTLGSLERRVYLIWVPQSKCPSGDHILLLPYNYTELDNSWKHFQPYYLISFSQQLCGIAERR